MINRVEANLNQVVVHQLGKKSEGEDVTFSQELIDISNADIHQTLLQYFIDTFKEPDFFTFTFNDGDFILNPLYNYLGNVFDDPSSFYEHSVKIARLLHDKSSNPLIKSGDFCMAYIHNILIDDEMVDAIGIFKSENKDDFILIDKVDQKIDLQIQKGINTSKMDKACLILNTERDTGFKILNIDHSNRQKEARYWRDDFLIIEARSDDYHSTTNLIRMTAEFVKKRLPAEAPLDKKDQSAYLKKSEDYFKNQESFELQDYKEQVFQSEEVSAAFEEYRREEQPSRAHQDSFAISEYAVKKQSKVFKSVIKLDKNFHVYVHGDNSKITKGELENGQKYYMLYYDEER